MGGRIVDEVIGVELRKELRGGANEVGESAEIMLRAE